MTRSLSKFFVFLFIFTSSLAMLSASVPVSVSLCSNSSMEINYFRDRSYSVKIDPSNLITVSSTSPIYYKYKIKNPEIYSFIGFRIVEYVDGKRASTTIVPDSGYIEIPPGSSDISIEPIGEYKKRTILLSDYSDGNRINGIWTVSDVSTMEDSIDLNPLNKYHVSYTYDESKYYIERIEPEKKVFAITDGSVVFSPENPKTGKNLPSEYLIELESYTHIAIDIPSRVVSVILEDGSVIDASEVKTRKFKSGENFTVETAFDYKIVSTPLEIEETHVLDDRRVFSVSVPEDNDSYSILIRAEKVATEQIEFDLSGYTESSALSLSTDRKSYETDDLRAKGMVVLTEGDILYIENKNESRSERLLLSVEGRDGNDIYDYDLRPGEVLSYGFGTLESITAVVEKGYRYSEVSIDSEEINARFYKNGNEIKEDEFLSLGDVVEIEIDAPEHLVVSGKNIARGSDSASFKIDENTTRNDFRIIVQNREGLYFNPQSYVYDEGVVVFSLNGIDIKEEIFIESGNTISYRAVSISDGYRFDDGDITVRGKDLTLKALDSIKFTEKVLSEVGIDKPRYGGDVSILYNGRILTDDSVSLYAGERLDFIYYPAPGWAKSTDKTKAPDYIIVKESDTIVQLSSAFVERDYHKPNVKITVSESLGKDFKVNLEDMGKGTIVYKDNRTFGIKNSTYTEDIGKVDSTIIPFKIYGNHLKDGEALSVDVVLYNDTMTEIAKYGALFVDVAFSYDFDGFKDDATTIEFIFSKVKAEMYQRAVLENAKVSLFTGTREIEPGQIVELTGKVSFTIQADDGYLLYLGKTPKKDGYSSVEISFENYLDIIDEILSEYEAKKVYSLELFYGDYDEIYVYRLNGQIVSGNLIEFVEGDVLELSYTAPPGHRVSNASIFNSRKTTASIVLGESNDKGIVDKFSFGIVSMREVR